MVQVSCSNTMFTMEGEKRAEREWLHFIGKLGMSELNTS